MRRFNKNDADVKVICRYFSKENQPGYKCILPGGAIYYSINPRFNYYYCDKSFYISWTSFIINRRHLIEVK